MAFKIRNGVGTIDTVGLGTIFVGSTGQGKYPPAEKSYPLFTFEPKLGEGGILVFKHGRGMLHEHLTFYQFWWEGKMLKIDYQIKHPARSFSDSNDLGLIVQVRDWYYVTEEPRDKNHNYKVVGLFDMLQYIEGKIELKDLDCRSRSYVRQKKFEKRLADLEQENARINRDMKARTEIYEGIVAAMQDTRHRAVEQMNSYWVILNDLQAKVRKRRFFRWLFGKANQQTLKNLLAQHVIFEP